MSNIAPIMSLRPRNFQLVGRIWRGRSVDYLRAGYSLRRLRGVHKCAARERVMQMPVSLGRPIPSALKSALDSRNLSGIGLVNSVRSKPQTRSKPSLAQGIKGTIASFLRR